MDKQKESEVNPLQIRKELDEAKARVAGHAKSLSAKEYITDHPYITLGAAFLSGIVMGGSHEARGHMAKAVMDIVSSELAHYKEEKKKGE